MYALRAVLELSTRPAGCPVSSTELATRGDMPARFLPQVLRSLVRSGILISVTGVSGGYILAREPRRIRLLDIVESFGSPLLLQPPGVSELSPLVRDRLIVVLRKTTDAAREELSKFSIADLVLRPCLLPTYANETTEVIGEGPRTN
jgi:Rrf2 family protein